MLQHKLGEGRGGVQLYEGKEKRGGGQWLGEEESITFREKEKREGEAGIVTFEENKEKKEGEAGIVTFEENKEKKKDGEVGIVTFEENN